MPLVTVKNNTNRTLGFHLPGGQLIEVASKKHVNDIEMSQEQLTSIKAASDLTFTVHGESENDNAAKSELSEKLNTELTELKKSVEDWKKEVTAVRDALSAAQVTIDHQQTVIDGNAAVVEKLNAELATAKEENEMVFLELQELKKPDAESKKEETEKSKGKK